jgi:hypothetical protein
VASTIHPSLVTERRGQRAGILLVALGVPAERDHAVPGEAERHGAPGAGAGRHHLQRWGLMDSARHFIGCRVTQETRARNAFNDAASTIRQSLSSGFQVTGLQSFNLDRPNALEFFEVYKGVVPEFNMMVGTDV